MRWYNTQIPQHSKKQKKAESEESEGKLVHNITPPPSKVATQYPHFVSQKHCKQLYVHTVMELIRKYNLWNP